MARPSPRPGAFTIVELLVVIAVISVLMAILVPALDRARERGLLAQSLSNLHQVQIAGGAYSLDNKETLPFTPTYRRGSAAGPDSGPLEGLCGWSFAGKNNAPEWAGRPFDVEAADRPLNPYLSPGATLDAPDAPATLPASDPARKRTQIPVLQTRGYEDSLQRAWPDAIPGVSCYDDVGTSYLLNLQWLAQFSTIADPASRLEIGLSRFRSAANAAPSRFVWLTDQSGDAVPRSTDPGYVWNNAFDDDNKSALAFIDGHVLYASVKPGQTVRPDYTLTLPSP